MAQRNLFHPNTPIGNGGGSGYGVGDYFVTVNFEIDVEVDAFYLAYYEYAGRPTFEAYIKEVSTGATLVTSPQVLGHGQPTQQWLEFPLAKTKLLAGADYELHFKNIDLNFARNDNPILPSTFQDTIYNFNVTHKAGMFWFGLSVKPAIDKKVLFEDGTEIKRFDLTTNAWVVVGNAPATEEMFLNNGMTDSDVASIPSNAIQSLVNEFVRVLVHTVKVPPYNMKLYFNAVPQNSLVLANGDIDITSVESINQIKIDTWVYNWEASVKNIVSFDKGETWFTWYQEAWTPVDVTNMDELSTIAMHHVTMQNLTKDNWSSIRGTSNTVRLGYILSIEKIDDYAKVDTLTTNFDMRGIWRVYKNAVIEFPSNNRVRVFVYEDGDYKVNY